MLKSGWRYISVKVPRPIYGWIYRQDPEILPLLRTPYNGSWQRSTFYGRAFNIYPVELLRLEVSKMTIHNEQLPAKCRAALVQLSCDPYFLPR